MTVTDFLSRLRKGSYHQKGAILSLDCGWVDDFGGIYEDVHRLMSQYPGVNANEGKLSYVQPEGEYIVHSLLEYENSLQREMFTDMDAAWSKRIAGKEFWLPAAFPHLAQFIAKFPEAMNFTIKTFNGPSRIAPHEERIFHEANGSKYARIRLHLPITSLPNARVIVQNREFQYLPGRLYYLNNSCVHYATSPDEGQRIHLIWDCVLTDRLFDAVFARAEEMAGALISPKFRYYFNTFPGKLPQWTQPWLWNNLLRQIQYRIGKDRDVSVWTLEEAKQL